MQTKIIIRGFSSLVIVGVLVVLTMSSGSARADKRQWLEETSRFCDLMAASDYLKALEASHRVLEQAQKSFPGETLEVAAGHSGVGLAYAKLGRFSEAAPFCEKAVDFLKKIPDKDELFFAGTVESLGLVYLQLGRLREAEELLWQSYETAKTHPNSDDYQKGTSLHNLGALYAKKGDFVQAEDFLLRALETKKKFPELRDRDLAITLSALLDAYRATSQDDKARQVRDQLRGLYRSTKE